MTDPVIAPDGTDVTPVDGPAVVAPDTATTQDPEYAAWKAEKDAKAQEEADAKAAADEKANNPSKIDGYEEEFMSWLDGVARHLSLPLPWHGKDAE